MVPSTWPAPVGVLGGERPTALGLHHDHRERVGDDVVQFAGDPGALLDGGAALPLLLLGQPEPRRSASDWLRWAAFSADSRRRRPIR